MTSKTMQKFPETREDNIIRVACDDGWRFGVAPTPVPLRCRHNAPVWNGRTMVDAGCR